MEMYRIGFYECRVGKEERGAIVVAIDHFLLPNYWCNW
jgi:hypothetical protein